MLEFGPGTPGDAKATRYVCFELGPAKVEKPPFPLAQNGRKPARGLLTHLLAGRKLRFGLLNAQRHRQRQQRWHTGQIKQRRYVP